jgi:hypothetical protein
VQRSRGCEKQRYATQKARQPPTIAVGHLTTQQASVPVQARPYGRAFVSRWQRPYRYSGGIWTSVRILPQITGRVPDLAVFDLAIDSKLRACDPVKLRVRNIADGECIAARAIVMRQKSSLSSSTSQNRLRDRPKDSMLQVKDFVRRAGSNVVL